MKRWLWWLPLTETTCSYFMEMQMRSCTEKWAPKGRGNPYASRIGEQLTFPTLEQTGDQNGSSGALGRIHCQPDYFLGAICQRLLFLFGDRQDRQIRYLLRTTLLISKNSTCLGQPLFSLHICKFPCVSCLSHTDTHTHPFRGTLTNSI